MTFLRKKWRVYLCLAVIATTLASCFNLNSWLIILLTICRLADGRPADTIRTACKDKIFWAWAAIFLLDLAGLCYTHDLSTGWKFVESKATLLAIPFIICGGPFANREQLRQLWQGYIYIVLIACCYCLTIATWHFTQTHDPFTFFYHQLSAPLDINAIFLSAYIITAILFLLPSRKTPLIVFFTGMVVLLTSKLLLILLVLVFVYYKKWLATALLAGGLLLSILIVKENPVAIRYRQIMPPYTEYNGVSLRALIWRSAIEILNEQHAWITGVTAGDSQTLLDEKYQAAGCPRYHKYNFHNEFIEIGVRSGLIGLGVFLVSCALFMQLAAASPDKSAWPTVIMVLLLSMTESMLEAQHPAFFCCWFITLYRIKRS